MPEKTICPNCGRPILADHCETCSGIDEGEHAQPETPEARLDRATAELSQVLREIVLFSAGKGL